MKNIINSIFKTFVLSLCIVAQATFVHAQTAALLPNASQQYFDNNGNPLSSGSVGYYIPGTLTAKQVWQDDSQTTAWTNPITLNAGGRPPSDKGIFGSGTYRQIVKDRNNNTIWDQTTAATGTGGAGSAVGDGNLVGTILPWSGLTAPNQYLFTYGQTILRASYPSLYTAITLSTNATCVGGSMTLSGISDTTSIAIGAAVEGNCIVAGTTVTAKTISTVTLSIAASISTNITATFFPYGNGNGTTTFTLPDLRGKTLAGRTNMGGTASSNLTSTYYGTGPDGLGATGGSQSKTLLTANLPPYTPAGSVAIIDPGHTHTSDANKATNASGGTGGAGVPTSVAATINSATTGITATFAGTAQGGSSTSFSLIQPSITMNYVIKVTPDTSTSIVTGVASLGGMTGVLACGTGLTCTSNTVSVGSGGFVEGVAGYALTGNGIGTPSSYQGFTQSGTGASVRIWQDKNRDIINAADFGVLCDGTTNEVTNINKAIDAAFARGGAIVNLPNTGSACIMGVTSIVLKNGTYLTGVPGSPLKLNALYANYAILSSCSDCGLISPLKLDMGDYDGGAASAAVAFTSGTNWIVDGIHIAKMGRFGIVWNASTNHKITNNIIEVTTPVNTQNQAILGICSTPSTGGSIINNRISGSGADVCDSKLTIAGNYISGWKFGAGLTFEQNSACYSNTIQYNYFIGGLGVDSNGYTVGGLENWCPQSTVIGNYAANNAGVGFEIGGKNNTVVGNIAENNWLGSTGHGMSCRYGTATYNCSGSIFESNISTNTAGGVTQTYGLAFQGTGVGVVTGVIVGVNNFSGNVTSTIDLGTPAQTVLMSSAVSAQVSGGIPYFDSVKSMASSAVLTANAPILGGGAGVAPFSGSRSGNTTVFGTTSGTLTANNCVKFDASGNLVASGSTCISAAAALTKADDTNVTLTLGGSPTTALLAATSITAGWTGTLAAARLNSNVVQAITNDTNVTGSIAAQNLTLGWTGTLAVSRGGTGLGSGTSGGIPYFNSTSTMASSGLLTANQIMIGGGAGVAPSTFACATTTTVVHGGTPPTCSAVTLTTDVTGRLPLANLAQGSALSVLGVTGNATADNASITAASDNQVMRRSGTSVAFGSIDLSQSNAVGSSILGTANGGAVNTAWTSFTPSFAATGGTSVVFTDAGSAYLIEGKKFFYRLVVTITYATVLTTATWTLPVALTAKGYTNAFVVCVNTGFFGVSFFSPSSATLAITAAIGAPSMFTASGNAYIISGELEIN